jgi:hypothetical protein
VMNWCDCVIVWVCLFVCKRIRSKKERLRDKGVVVVI